MLKQIAEIPNISNCEEVTFWIRDQWRSNFTARRWSCPRSRFFLWSFRHCRYSSKFESMHLQMLPTFHLRRAWRPQRRFITLSRGFWRATLQRQITITEHPSQPCFQGDVVFNSMKRAFHLIGSPSEESIAFQSKRNDNFYCYFPPGKM